MRKLTLLISMLFLSLGTAWAQTTFKSVVENAFATGSWTHHGTASGSWYGKAVAKTNPELTVEVDDQAANTIGYSTSNVRRPWLKAGYSYTISLPNGYRIVSYKLTTQSTSSGYNGTFTYTSDKGGNVTESEAQKVNTDKSVEVSGLLNQSIKLVINGSAGGANYGILITGLEITYTTPVAKINENDYYTFADALAAATEGQTITLLDDATPALASQRAITKAAVIDLGGKTLTLTEDDLYFGTTTFKNGTIIVDPSVKPSTAVFWMFANQTLTFDNVKIVATGVTGTYLIGLDGNNSDLNLLNGSEILVENTTALDLDIICVNASTGNDIKVENSKVNVTNLDGRVFFRGNYTVAGNSEINLEGITKAGFRIEAGQTLSIEGTSKVNISGEPRDGGIHLTDLSATYTKAETATVNATVNEPKVAKVGENTYRTLAQAVAAVEDGGTITLIANETFTKTNRTHNSGTWYDGLYYVGDKSFTIDLGGFTISQDGAVNDYLLNFKNSGSKANTITLKNGTIDAGTAAFCAICTSSSQANELTINTENINIINNISNGSTIKLRGGAVLNVRGGTKITGKDSYLGIECVASTVNIYDGAEIYMNGTSSYNGCLVGACGAGTVNVYGGKGKGVKGGFIAMTSGGTINISGGEWIANTDGTVGNNSNLYVLTAQSNINEQGFVGPAIINVNGGTFRGGMDAWVLNNHKDEKAELNIKGGNFNANPTNYVAEGYIAVENNGVWNVVKAAAKVGGVAYATLEKAFKAATDGCTIDILSDVTVDYNWDARNTGAKFTVPVTINGNGNTIKFTASVNDNNYQAPFRFEADATVKNLTIDMSEVTDNRFRAISSKGNLTVDGCKFIGKDESLNCRAIIFGEGAGANVGNLAIAITNSEFINWKRGITDNENGQDVKTATITGNTLENAAVYVSAYENVIFTGNTVAGAYVDIRSNTANSSLNVTATGNTLEENTDTAYNYIKATGNIDQEGFKVYAVAKIGDVEYTTIEKAYAALQEGDEIVILKKGSYALTVKNNVTITGAVAGVEFANIGAFGCNGANVTFNNVTFTYAENSTYKGLQHSGNLVYNNCTFNGQVFLYGQSETFNNCTFNTQDSNNYNVWTYGAKNVAFNGCTFNSAGKSVLIYAESASVTNNVTVTKSQFNASQEVEGKAAIEMDSSLSGAINLTIDGETTATGFATGNVSGNSLWNNKKGNSTDANNDITVKVGDNTVLAPIFEAQIGDAQYRFFQAAVDAVKNGETITLLADVAGNITLTEKTGLYYTIDGNGKTMKGSINVASLSDTEDNRRITIKNINFVDTADANVDFISSVNTNHYPRLTIEDCTFTGSGNDGDVAVRLKSSHSVVIKDCEATGLHSFIQNTSGWNLTIENVTVTESKSAFALGTVQGVTVKGVNVDVKGYGIRMDAQYNNNAVLENNTVKAFIPVVVRKAEVESNITVQGTNNFEATNTDGLWMAVGTSEYETNGKMPTAATAQVVVSLNDANLDNEGIYGDYVVLAGKGTEAEPYLIHDIKELVAFRNSVNGGETRYSAPGVWVALAADIDLADENWVGIGAMTAEHGFMGNFDGKNFKIKNLTITNPALDSDGYAYAGLFGLTEGTDKDNQNTIKNLTIENVTINTTGHIASAAIAYAYYTVVDNVTVCGDIKIQGGDYTAGVLAYTRRCVNASNLAVVGNEGSCIEGAQVVGGVIADIQTNGGLVADYKNFTAEGITVKGTKMVGGISGIIATQTLNGAAVKNVTLSSGDSRVGTIAGAFGGTSTISNVTVENVEGATAVIGAAYDGAKAVEARIGDTYYATLANAVAAAKEGDHITMLAPVTVAAGETLTLDKNVTITYTSNVAGEDMITNRGTLNISAGTLTYVNTDATASNVTVSTISTEAGSTLVVDGGTIENKTVKADGSSIYSYAIDILTNGSLGDVNVTINGGTVYSDYMAIRQFNNGTACKNSLTINGGNIYGAKRAVQVHMDNNAAYTAIKGGKLEAGEGGYALCNFAATSDLTVTGGEFIGAVYSASEKFISGGIYDAEVYAGYCAEGYMPNKNVNGTYGVVAITDAYASIDGVTYGSLKAAINAAKAGDTITLLQDVKENVTISKNLTIDGADNTITGMITTDGKGLKITVKNVKFDGNNKSINYAMRADDNNKLVVENCTVNNYIYGFLYANKSNDKVVVKNVTVENCAEYGAYLVAVNSASFENFTVNGNTKYGIAVANAGARTVNLKNVTFENAEQPLHINENGTGKVTFNFSGSNEMSKEEFYTSQYVKVVAAAQVGTKVCGSLQDAVVAANNGETVKVLADVNMTTANFVTQVDGYATLVNVAGKAVTIDLNGKKVTVNAADADLNGKAKGNMLMSVFHADPNGTLTLTDSSAEGTGTVELFANDATVYGLIVSENTYDKSNPGKIIVNGGNYIADRLSDSMIFADINEVITVNGGNFHLGNVGSSGVNGKPWIFNASGNNQIHINVNGGTYNADVAKQYWNYEVNLGEGLTTTNNGDGTWTVVPAVATVGNVGFGSIQEAIDAAQEGETVKLVKDVVYNDNDVFVGSVGKTLVEVAGKNIVLDMNGKNIDVTYTGPNYLLSVIHVADGAGLTVTGEGSIDVKGLNADGAAAKNVAYVFYKSGTTGYLTIENGTFHMNDAADSMVYTNGDEIVTINGGTFILDAVASQTNGFPVIFSTQGNNERQIVVNAGTFNYDINHQIRPFEPYVAPEKALKKVVIDGRDMWTIVPAQAYVTEMLGGWVNEPGEYAHKVGYATVADAIKATNELGNTVTILAGEYTGNLNVNKGITVQGEVDAEGNNLVTFNGKLNITADGATVKNININNPAGSAAYVGAKDVVVDGCQVVGNNGFRSCYTSGTVTFKNSTITGATYGIHFDGNAGGNIVIENCTITGWTSFAKTIENVAISGTTFAEGNYNKLRLYQNATITDCTFNEKMTVDFGTNNTTAAFNNCTVENGKALTDVIYIADIAEMGVVVTVDGVPVSVAAKVGEQYYLSLQAAIDAATEGQTVTIISDIALTEGVTVAADDNLFIALNGKTITGIPAEAKAFATITNRGTLTIQGNGAVVTDHQLAGSTGYAVNTITNCGTLTIDGATIENKSTANNQIGYAIDNNSTSADATVTIVNGNVTVSGSNYYDGIRQFCNSTTAENDVYVVGGEVSTIWMQNPSDGATKNTKDVNGSVTIEGGNVGALYLEPSANFEAAITAGHVGNVEYFQTAEGRDLKEFVTGGTFGTLISENFLAWGYQLTGDTAPYTVEATGRREVVTFVDGEFTEYTNENDIEVGTLTYKRSFSKYWTPLYVPFEIPVSQLAEQGFEVAFINGVRRNDTDYDGELDKFEMEVIYIHGGDNCDGSGKTLKANYPYFVRSKDVTKTLEVVLTDATLYASKENGFDCTTFTEKFVITGNNNVMNPADFAENDYTVAVKDGQSGWSNSATGALKPFRFYMTVTDRAENLPVVYIKSMSIVVRGEELPDGTTVIYDVNAENNGDDVIYDLNGCRVTKAEKGGIYIINGKKVLIK